MLKFILYWATFHTLGRLPLPLLYTLMSAVASIGYRVAPGIRRNIDDNLRHAMPTASEVKRGSTAKRILRNVAMYYADVAHLPRMDLKHFFDKRLKFHGLDEYLRPAIAEGKGVIILSAHYGNPELAVQALAHLGIPVFALTEPVHPRMSKLMDEFRASKGVTFEPVSVGSVKRVFQTLKRGGVVALMGDRDIEGPKEALPFFGVPTLMPTGPIEVGLRTGAAVIPCFCARKSKYVIEAWVEEPLELKLTGDFHPDVHAGMMEYIARLEARLRADPGQWAVIEAIWDGEKVMGGEGSDQKSHLRQESSVGAGERADG
jgi:phosphatidylinositol dimannoside acyltransferase